MPYKRNATERTCPRCKVKKPIDRFYKTVPYCKGACYNEYKQERKQNERLRKEEQRIRDAERRSKPGYRKKHGAYNKARQNAFIRLRDKYPITYATLLFEEQVKLGLHGEPKE